MAAAAITRNGREIAVNGIDNDHTTAVTAAGSRGIEAGIEAGIAAGTVVETEVVDGQDVDGTVIVTGVAIDRTTTADATGS